MFIYREGEVLIQKAHKYKVQIDIEKVKKELKVPKEANVEFYVEVPTGGDYSGHRLYIGEDVNLQVSINETEEVVIKGGDAYKE